MITGLTRWVDLAGISIHRHHSEVDHDVARLTSDVSDIHAAPEVMLDLRQERQRVVIVHKAHHFAGLQRIERTENGRVAETSGNAARVEDVLLGENGKDVCWISHGCFS